MKTQGALTIGGGIASGLLFMAALQAPATPLAIFLYYLPTLALFFVGLSGGKRQLGLAIILALIAIFLLSSLIPAGDNFSGYLILTALPVAILVNRALQTRRNKKGQALHYPAGLLVSWLTAIGAVPLALVGAYLIYTGSGLQTVLVTAIDQFSSQMQAMGNLDAATLQSVRTNLQYGVSIMPGTVILVSLVMILLNGVTAQTILVKTGDNLRPSPDFKNMILPRSLFWLLVASVATAFLTSGEIAYLARNLSIILLLPFALQGLSLIHNRTRDWPNRQWILSLFYMVIVILWPALLVITVAGLYSHWKNQYFNTKEKTSWK